jgi:hypothetical protein
MSAQIAIRSAVLGAAAVLLLVLVPTPRADAAFGLRPQPEGFRSTTLEAGGTEATQAGAHPFALRTEINFDQALDGSAEGGVRSIRIDRPPGAVENTQVVEACSAQLFGTSRVSPFEESRSGESCPVRSQVGIITLRGNLPGGGPRTFGLFDLLPGPGQAALIGANPFGTPITFASHIQSAEGVFSMSLEAAEIPQSLGLSGMTITQWGNPWLAAHDLQRGNCLNEVEPAAGFGEEATLDPEPRPIPSQYKAGTCSVGNPIGFPPVAYLTLPSSCAPGQSALLATSWQSGASASATQASQTTGCESRFQAIHTEVRPLSDRAASPSGLDVNVDVNQGNLTSNVTEAGRLNANVLAASQLRSVTLNLPEGMTINPSVAAGLGVCTPAQFEAESSVLVPGVGCPPESKIGQFTVESPILGEAVTGGVFIASPRNNPSGSLIALYLVGRAPQRGVLVKLAGQVVPDPSSGRLTATFDHLPQLPYAHLNVHLREGQRAPLATPGLCGTYTASTDSVPWLDPGTDLKSEAVFTLKSGPGGGACPSAGAPFSPTATAGSYSRSAGAHTPFYLKLDRTDTDQEITSYSAQLPPGLLADLSGVPFCPDGAIAAAASGGGFDQTAHPSCPAASKIGHTTAGYGLGGALAYAPGNLYLAGPYHGSPLSVVAIDSATVGPFDLGVIVVRSAIRVDPLTAQVSIDSAGSDPIPHIIDGIPLHLRDIRIYIDRPNFMVNPTSCEHFAVSSTLTGSGASFANPADDTTATVSDPYQVAFCSSLGFEPRMELRLKGGTRRGKFPSLTATVTPHPGQANIRATSVTLPPSLFLEQNHIKTICSRAQSAAGSCPAASIYGHARAITPLLEDPLEGPVYLRASANKLPDLVAQLGGRGVRIDVVGRIDSKKGGMRATYELLPDAPVTKFALTLNGGKRGLLVNSDDTCDGAHATARMLGQNNKGVVLKPPVVNPACKKQTNAKQKNKPKHKKKVGGHGR